MKLFRASISMLATAALALTALVFQPAAASAASAWDVNTDYAATFNGTGSYMEANGPVIPTGGDFTVEAWVYYDGTDGMREVISQGDDGINFMIGSLWGGIRIKSFTDAPSWTVNGWQHIAVTFDSANLLGHVYLNGILVGRIDDMLNPSELPFKIGAQFGSYGEYWSGKIDEVKIWNTNRDGSVVDDMNSRAYAEEPGLLAYYDFNSPTAIPGGDFTITDLSGNSHDLTAHGFTTDSFADIATSTPTGTNNRDLLVTFPRTYLPTSGKWAVPTGYVSAQVLLVGGGGGGGAWVGGGGGGGEVQDTSSFTVSAGDKFPVVVGQGGRGATSINSWYKYRGVIKFADNGQSTTFGSYSALGGGGGGSYAGDFFETAAPKSAATGGGGSGSPNTINIGTADMWSNGGAGTTGKGYPGGNGPLPMWDLLTTGGGGGAGGPGQDSGSDGRTSGDGGIGKTSAVTGLTYGGGGGGGIHRTLDLSYLGSAGHGKDGGGDGNGPTQLGQTAVRASDGNVNSGGGGGGAGLNGNYFSEGGSGGSGVVTVKLKAPVVVSQVTQFGCDGTSSLNGVTVKAGHPKFFYIDSSDDYKYDANYLDYSVKSDTARSDLWVEVSGFTGDSITLANPADASQPVGAVAAGGWGSAFFLAKASKASTSAQSHVVKVYDRKPGSGGAVPIYSCTYNFNGVQDVSKNSSNKISSTAITTVSSVGTTFTVTVLGDSGTIGAGNTTDGRLLWLSPAAKSTWPSSAARLESATITTYSDSARTTALKTFTTTLALNTGASLPATTRQYYKAIYTFRVIGNATAVAQVTPSAMISNSTTVKHPESAPSGNGTTVDLTNPASKVTVTSSASKDTTVLPNGKTVITYTITAKNNGTAEATLDEITDTSKSDSKESYVSGSGKQDGHDDKDGEHQDGDSKTIVFSGPFTIAAGATKTWTYQVEVDTCQAGDTYNYEHESEGKEGGSKEKETKKDNKGSGDKDDEKEDHSYKVGSSESKDSHVEVTGKCGVETAAVKPFDLPQPISVTTGSAVPVGTTSATIYGSIDPNGQPNLPVKFVYSTDSTLSNPTVVNMTATTGATTAYSINKALTGLSSGTKYYYRLVVTNGLNNVYGMVYNFTTDLPPGVPTATTTSVTNILNTDHGATINGDITALRVSGGAKVRFEWAADNSNGACTSVGTVTSSGLLQNEVGGVNVDLVLTNQGASSQSFRATGLTADTKYCGRIVALHGSGYSTVVNGVWKSWTQAPKTAQAITWQSTMAPLAAGGTTTVVATADSSLAVTYTSNDTSICTVDASTGAVTAVATFGICSITATQDGDASYYAAEPVTLSFDIVPPVVTTDTLPRVTYQGSYSQTLEAAGGDGSYSNWSLATGSLPNGLTLNSDGTISGTPSLAGVYTFTVTVESNGITSAEKTLTIVVDAASLDVYAADATVTFGDAVPTVGFTYGGFAATDGPNDIATPPSCFTNYMVGDGVAATTDVTACKDGWDENYVMTYHAGAVTISKFTINVRAINKAKQNVDGMAPSADPTLEYEVYPNVPGGQTLDDALPTGVSLSRDAGEVPGDYTIHASANSVGDNYTVNAIDGTFTVQTPKKVPTIIPFDYSITYGDEVNTDYMTVAQSDGANVPGTMSYYYFDANGVQQTISQHDVLPAGVYTIHLKFVPNDTSVYYPIVESEETLTVNQKTVTITGDELEKLVDELDPNLTYQSAGFVGSDGVTDLGQIEITRTLGEDPGTYTVSTSGGSNPNYNVIHAQAVFHISSLSVSIADNGDGTNPREFNVVCSAAKANTLVTLSIDGTVIGTLTTNANGTCPSTKITVPESFGSGAHTIGAAGFYPSGRTGLANSASAIFAPSAVNPGGAQMYDVTYHANDNSNNIQLQSYLDQATTALDFANPWTRAHYTFKGWSTDANATAPDSSLTISANGDLYAVWEAIPITWNVVYHANDGTAKATTVNYADGATTALDKSNSWTRSGYTFKGWATSNSATAADTSLTVTADGDLYAVWEALPVTHTVTYFANDGTTKKTTQTLTHGDTTALDFANPWTRTGYSFLGWNTNKSATAALTTKTINANTSLYAIWKKDSSGSTGSSKTSKKLVLPGFAGGSPVLTDVMKAKVRAFLKANPTLTYVTVTGFTMGPKVLKVDQALANNRALATYNYIKSIRPSIKLHKTSGKPTTDPGAPIRRVEIVLANY